MEQEIRAIDTKADVVFFGDSLTERGLWSELFPQLRISNRGVGGYRLLQIAKMVDETRGPIRVAVLMGGVNDIYAGHRYETIADDYKTLIKSITSKSSHTVVESTLFTSNAAKNEITVRLNKTIQADCQAVPTCEYLDMNRVLAPSGKLEPKDTVDGVHLNGSRYALWATALRPYVQPVQE
jgi:lysophospholipase L1-like esterase